MVGLNLTTALEQIKEEMNKRSSDEGETVPKQGLMGSAIGGNDKPSPFSVILDSLSRLKEKREISQKELSRYQSQRPMSFAGAAVPEITDEDLRKFQSDARINPMNFSGSIIKERDILESDIMKDVRADAAEKLVEEEPTVDIAKAIEQDQLGLMVKPVQKDLISGADKKGEKASLSNQKLTVQYLEDNFVDTYLTEHEGTTAHASLEGGRRTGAYGVKNIPKGMSRSDYSSDAEFAAAVSLYHYQKVQRKYNTLDKAKLWKSFPPSAQMAILDLQFNVGTVGQTPTKTNLKDSLENTLEFVGMTAKDGTKGSLMSLAKRRALNWNKVTKDSSSLTPIKTIKQIPTSSGGTRFEFIDKDDNIVYDFSNGRTPIKLDRSGNTTILTTTREETL
jgi:hypothetical protein